MTFSGKQEGDDERSGQRRDREQEKRDSDGHRPVDPDTVREPKPGKRGR